MRGLRPQQAILAVVHRLCRLVWKILHEGVRYQEFGPAVDARGRQSRTARILKELRRLGYQIQPPHEPAPA